MSSVPFLYRVAVRAARRSAPLLAFGESKVARGIRGRRDAVDALVRWGRGQRDPSRPTAWFHAPSVGEGLQAGAVVDAVRALRPGLQVAFTHFSPSAEHLGEGLGADVSAYLPWDVGEDAARVLNALEPALLAFTKTEVWPVLTEEAASRSVPVAMVAATVRERSGRSSWPARLALRSTWGRLALVCAQAEDDAERLVGLGADRSAVHVVGDPGIDSAARRAADVDPSAPYLAPFVRDDRPVLVAGSTWPPDEDVLLSAWERLSAAGLSGLLVVAPHEPTPVRVRSLVDRLRANGRATVTLGEIERRGSAHAVDAVIVDRVGVLAHLYEVGSVAYVGGGFGRDGLHSVLEPAAVGVPTLFGPRHGHAPAAVGLLEVGAARAVGDATALAAAAKEWLADPESKNRATRHALDYIGAHRGAAARTAELLETLLRTTNSG